MVEALIFDVFGTVVDWRTGIAREAEAVFRHRGIDLDPYVFADAWRDEYDPAMARVRNGNRGYVALDLLHRENLDIILERFGLDNQFDEAARAAFSHAWEKLPPWPDSAIGLDRLKAQYIIAPCSNGSIALMTRLAKYGGLNWDAITGAELARNYKPQPEVYLASAAALGLEPAQVMMVAAHNRDLAAARETGLKTAFLPRPNEHGPGQTIDLTAEDDWDFVAADLADLAGKLGA